MGIAAAEKPSRDETSARRFVPATARTQVAPRDTSAEYRWSAADDFPLPIGPQTYSATLAVGWLSKIRTRAEAKELALQSWLTTIVASLEYQHAVVILAPQVHPRFGQRAEVRHHGLNHVIPGSLINASKVPVKT
jgi:hypothetical protein